MTLRLRFEVFGEVVLDRALERAADAAENMIPAWQVLRERFLRMEQRQFASEGAYGSGGWSPLSPRYGAWKARHYPGQTILRREDDLYLSLTQGPAVAVLQPSYMILGSDDEKGPYHQAGAGPLPRRRPVELPEFERREWVKVVQRHLFGGGAR